MLVQFFLLEREAIVLEVKLIKNSVLFIFFIFSFGMLEVGDGCEVGGRFR